MCITEIFPFNNIEDVVDFVANIDASSLPRNSMCYLSDKVFISFEINDKDHSSLLCDPELTSITLTPLIRSNKQQLLHSNQF